MSDVTEKPEPLSKRELNQVIQDEVTTYVRQDQELGGMRHEFRALGEQDAIAHPERYELQMRSLVGDLWVKVWDDCADHVSKPQQLALPGVLAWKGEPLEPFTNYPDTNAPGGWRMIATYDASVAQVQNSAIARLRKSARAVSKHSQEADQADAMVRAAHGNVEMKVRDVPGMAVTEGKAK